MTVLAAIAGNSDSSEILQIGQELASELDEPLTVVHVVDEDSQVVDKTSQHSLDSLLSAFVENTTSVQKIIRNGNPAEEITALANEIQPQYLIIGRRKRTPTGKLLLGSTTQPVLLESPSPVVTVPVGYADFKEGPILAAVDESNQASRVVEASVHLAKAYDRPLKLVHSLTRESFYSLAKGSLDQTGKPMSMDQIRSFGAEIADEAGSDVQYPYEPIGLVGKAGTRIPEYAHKHNASYVVVSGRRRSPAGQVAFGSVSQKIILNTAVPVLFTPTE